MALAQFLHPGRKKALEDSFRNQPAVTHLFSLFYLLIGLTVLGILSVSGVASVYGAEGLTLIALLIGLTHLLFGALGLLVPRERMPRNSRIALAPPGVQRALSAALLIAGLALTWLASTG